MTGLRWSGPHRRSCCCRERARPPEVLVVDGANVVGSRPDGWWRDRAGAARRLLGGMQSLEPPVVLVLEGAARAGVDPGRHGPVEVVHAAGSGDDTIVSVVTAASAAQAVTVVTADRELRSRVRAVGAATVSPQWLLDRLLSAPQALDYPRRTQGEVGKS